MIGLCPTKSHNYYIVGRRQERELQTEIDGGLSQPVSGGQSGKRGI